MKLILSGANGFIGTEIISRALAQPSITSLIALTRKPLPGPYSTNPKLKTIILEDFTSYPPSIISQLSGADACIWTIGAKSTNPEVTRKVTLEYAMAAARAFAELGKEQSRKFRFVFLSGIVAVRDQNSTVLMFGDSRKVAGQTEADLLALSKERPNDLEALIMRPASVLTKERTVHSVVRGSLPYTIRVDELAAALIDVAENGSEMDTLEHADLKQKGKDLIGKAAE